MIQIALLRGVNIGSAKRVAMADLRTLVAGLGFDDVRTLLNSGNVVYRADGVKPAIAAARIEQAILEHLGVSSRVTTLTGADLERITKENTLAAPDRNPSCLFVAFPRTVPDLKQLAPLTRQRWDPDIFALGSRAAYFWCGHGMSQSVIPDAVARAMGDAVTTRNWATVQKLLAMTK
jgi:uncharacterized protein (DUF1697 family)